MYAYLYLLIISNYIIENLLYNKVTRSSPYTDAAFHLIFKPVKDNSDYDHLQQTN